MMLLLKLFYTFFKIGLFGFGGGYGMLSLIQGEVVTHHAWMSMQEFTDIVAVSQMTPGPIGINSATYVGYTAVINSGGTTIQALLGSLTASFAVMLPSFVIMLVLSRYLMKYSRNPRFEALFSVLRPTVVGLIASAALLLMNSANFGSLNANSVQFFISIALFIFAFVALRLLKWSPILILVISGALGGIIYSVV